MSVPRARMRTALHHFLQQTVIAGLYFGAAQLAFTTAVMHGSASPVWPPTAVALLAVLRLGPGALPGLLVGALAANATRPVPALVVVFVTCFQLAEPFVTVACLRAWRVDTRLSHARDVVAFTIAVCAGALVSMLGGVATLVIADVVEPSGLLETAALWWLGNLAGALCLAPLFLVSGRRTIASRAEELTMLGAVAVLGTLVLVNGELRTYMLFPLLVWAGLRCRPRAGMAAALILAVLATTAAALTEGPFVSPDPEQTLLVSQGFILVCTLMLLLLTAISAERARAAKALAASEADKLALALEQAALRRVAEAAARSTETQEMLELAATEIVALLHVDVAKVMRFLPDERALVLVERGTFAHGQGDCQVVAIEPGGALDRVRAGVPTRDRVPDGRTCGIVERVAAPVRVEGAVWGAIVAGTGATEPLPDQTESRVARFADIVCLGVADAQAREQLTARATTDPLTGLLNHRAFHERLREETARAARHDRAISVAVFDIDGFKAINDSFGHAGGDAVLVEAARRLRASSRADEPAGRVGGDELAVIMPEVDGIGAHRAADRVRRAIGDEPYPGMGKITVSAGTCDLAQAQDAEDLLRLADGALYWAKANGKDVCFRYSPEVVEELSAVERAERLARSQALSAVRALARAIDAKDPSTTRHSERVADLVARLATTCGWEPRAVALMHSPAHVHDVGKIGVPDAVLLKPGRLNAADIAQIQRHAALGAQIAREVLVHEQAMWIRSHHERHDGHGYPDGLRGDQISEGAQLLAIADAWDAMTKARHYSAPMTAEEAWQECREQAGRQFSPHAVDALGRLLELGQMPAETAAPAAPADDQ